MAQETSTGRTLKSVSLAVALAASTLWPGAALAASTITGVVTFDGKGPPLKPITMDADRNPTKLPVILKVQNGRFTFAAAMKG